MYHSGVAQIKCIRVYFLMVVAGQPYQMAAKHWITVQDHFKTTIHSLTDKTWKFEV